MKLKHLFITALCVVCSLSGRAAEKVLLLDEGTWQSDNGRLSYFENGTMASNQLFMDVNHTKLGDTPLDIIQISDHLLAITVSGSNLVQFIDETGKNVGTTENLPNLRYMASDGRYLYVTSYAHECVTTAGTLTFTRGYVAKIDLESKKVVAAVEVGYEPESLALYRGHLFVANSGGYAYSENHDYESTVSVIDPTDMKVVRTVDTGKINLYGKMARVDNFLCIGSSGDYYSVAASTVLMDCDAVLAEEPDASCVRTIAAPCTYCAVAPDKSFYVVGTAFNYTTSQNDFNFMTIRPAEVFRDKGAGVAQTLPGTLTTDIKAMTAPHSLYVNPYSGYIYVTDAGDYVSAGSLYQWDNTGKFLGSYSAYICPGNMVALPPDGHFNGVEDIVIDRPAVDDANAPIFNLMGVRVTNPIPGQIYIQNGRKFIQR